MIKVLQVVKTNKGATWAFVQAQWLNSKGVKVVTVLPDLASDMAIKYKENNMEIIQGDFSLPIRTPWKIFSRIKKIRKVTKEVDPHLIHLHFVTNIMMFRIALRDSKIPRLFQIPGPLHLENVLFRKAEIMLSTNSDYWAGACKKTCEIYVSNKISNSRVFLAYYGGYGGSTTYEYKENSNKLSLEYNFNEENSLVGMVSYFYKPKTHLMQRRGLKGHEDFIDAIASIQLTNSKVIGVIIGDAWGESQKYVDKVKRYADKKCKGGIIFTGFRSDLKEIYRELDVAVHPSHSENLGGAAESLAASVPTVTTDIGGFPDIVINGITGYTVEVANPQSLAAGISKMLNDTDKAREMSKQGRILVEELLSIENTGENIIEIYNEILTNKKSG